MTKISTAESGPFHEGERAAQRFSGRTRARALGTSGDQVLHA